MERLKYIILNDPQHLFFTLIGLVFLLYPLYFKWEETKLKKRRTERTSGEVVDEESRSTTGVGIDLGSHRVPTRHPVVMFEVNGTKHRLVSPTGASWETLRKGQIVDVVYNPNNPRDAGLDHIALQSVENLLLWIFPLIGGGLFLWGLAQMALS